MFKLVDIHCHLLEYSKDNYLAKIEQDREIIHVSTAMNKQEIALHEEYGIRYWFAGIHPWDANLPTSEIARFYAALPFDKVLGLGEIGLDKNHPYAERQLFFLEKQVKTALELQLPALFHLVGNVYDFIKLHKRIKLRNMKIIHGFNSSYEVYKELDKLGFYFSLGKRILDNSNKEKLVREILNSKRFFLESDAPNNTELDEVKRVAECLETDYNIDIKELKEVLSKNFADLLKESCESIPKK